MHERRAHPDWYCQQQLTERPNIKERWNVEELTMMARKEAEATRRGVRFINQELLKGSSRTLESIKGARRRLDYKKKVEEFLQEVENVRDQEVEAGEDNEEVRDLRTYLIEAEPLVGDEYNARWLNDICSMVHSSSKERVGIELASYLNETFPPAKKNEVFNRHVANTEVAQGRKVRRREEYARVQDLWKRKPGECVKRILEDRLNQEPFMSKGQMEPYWRTIMTRPKTMSPKLARQTECHDDLWRPIEAQEIKDALPRKKSAPGPDGVLAEKIWKAPRDMMARVFTLLMWMEKLPESLCQSRTVLLPKTKNASEPGLFRPITMSSVIIRTFHKILANRLKKIELDPRQRAFREGDGCAENIVLLDMVLKYHHRENKKMFMAVLDMAKAFDSVSFPALMASLRSKGLPESMVRYIANVYEHGKTILQHGDWRSEKIHPTCGVKQGDPLSPIMFNFVMDGMLKNLKSGIGVNVDGAHLNVLAFADDIVLLASTKEGLQSLIDRVVDFLGDCGLDANAGKCVTLAVKTIPKQKKTVIDSSCKFKINNIQIPTLTATSEWTYLGVTFGADGVRCHDVMNSLEQKLARLTKAPLKPQQRLWAIRSVLIPGVMYQLVHCRVKFGYLKTLDKKIRMTLRKWLHLPKDCPNAYFHTNIRDGGLGVPSLRWWAPLQRLKALKRLGKNHFLQAKRTTTYLNSMISEAEKRLNNNGEVVEKAKDMEKLWSDLLYSSVDGGPLRSSAEVKGQHGWIGEPTRFLSGRDFVNCNKVRINALPTSSRTSRGRPGDRSCRAGCGLPETSNHIIQVCHRTNKLRIKRHNAVANYITRSLEGKGYLVEQEPTFSTAEGNRKPDVVATLGKTTLVIDAQVVNDQMNLEEANQNKINYYKNNSTLAQKIKEKYGSDTILTLAATLTWRGIWSKTSAEELLRLGAIRKRDLPVISTRALVGSVAAWNIFNKVTSYRRRGNRQGIG